MIPKLSVQPLVENAIKHGTNIEPPWYIKVYGDVIGDRWQITVCDNGPGFSAKSFERFNENKGQLSHDNFGDGEKIKGVGLINTFNRLKLTYREKMIFEIKNEPDGGASVTIGGSVDK
jgi:two-component system sensor histidine kinase YesM